MQITNIIKTNGSYFTFTVKGCPIPGENFR